MNLSQLIKDYPEIAALFLNYSGNSIVILSNYEYKIQYCNNNLFELLHTPNKPLDRFLGDILCPLEGKEFSLIVSHSTNSLLPQIFKVCYTQVLFKCYSFNIQEGYLLFGDRIGSTDNEILESMSLLNNELSNLSRKLSKKNRELEKANLKIKELMRTDALTGLANRGYFQERLQEAFSLSKRKGLSFSLLMADLDYFKSINDKYGHDAGDKVLKSFGYLLKNFCRTEDLPARFGGEEFIILLPQTNSHGALNLGERIRTSLKAQEILDNETKVTVSIGIAELKDSDNQERLLKRADQALYVAKERGRDQCFVST